MRTRRVLFVLPTGGGKTVCFAYITLHAAAKGNRVIVLSHRQEISDQISGALSAMAVPHGRIQPGYPMTTDLVQVAMVQTVLRRLTAIPEPALAVFDEAHHAVAGSWAAVAAAWPNAKILGVTATPERLDGVGLRQAFDEMVLGPDVRALIDAGYLAPFRFLAPINEIDLTRVRSLGGDYNVADLERAVDQAGITGDVVAHYLAHLDGRTALAFCVTVAHAEHVALRFRDQGIAAASIDGTMRPGQRHELVNKLRDGTIRVLTSCEIISEGFDAPAVGGAILLRPTQSFALYRQQVGRCLRPKPDGSAAVIADHVGNVHRHGLPDAPHLWSLDSTERAGTAACDDAEEPAERAPGREPLAERDGVLAEFVPPHWANGLDLRSATGRDWFRLMDYAAGDVGRLREVQLARGYRAGWLRYALAEARQGQRAGKSGGQI